MTGMLPLGVLLSNRSAELGLDRAGIARRLGYRNVAKGIRRLDALADGGPASGLPGAPALADALGLPFPEVEAAFEATRAELARRQASARAAQEAAWRAAFVPHAMILTERTRPEPIFVAAALGGERALRIPLDTARPELTFPAQALAALPGKLRNGGIPAWGRATGFAVNYSPDRAVLFDLDGAPVAEQDAAHRVGRASLSAGGRPFPVPV